MPRRSEQPTPRLQLQLSPELTARVRQYHRDNGLPGTAQDSARELLAAALDYPEVESSLLRSARQRVFDLTQRDFRSFADAVVEQLTSEWQRRSRDMAAAEREVGREGVGDVGNGSEARPRD